MDNFWQSYRRSTFNRAKSFSTIRRASSVGKLVNRLHIPPFSVDSPVWLGASYITLEWRGSIGEYWSFPLPILKPSLLPNFCLAVRWPRSGDGPITRYKLWENVGEDLDYELYNGQTISSDFALEIWTTESNLVTSLDSDYYIPISLLTVATQCHDEALPTFELDRWCELFTTSFPTPLPLEFSQCFADLSNPIIIDTEDILINHLGKFVINNNTIPVSWKSI